MKKRTEVFLVLLNIKFLIIICVKNIKKNLQHLRFFGVKKYS